MTEAGPAAQLLADAAWLETQATSVCCNQHATRVLKVQEPLCRHEPRVLPVLRSSNTVQH